MTGDQTPMGKDQLGPRKTRPKRRRKRKNNGSILIFCIITILILGCGGYVAWVLFSPSFEFIDYREQLNIAPDQVVVVLHDQRLDMSGMPAPVMNNDDIYFSLEFIEAHIDEYIFWDSNAQILTITKPDRVQRLSPEQPNFYEMGNPVAAEGSITLFENRPFVPTKLLMQLYHVSFEHIVETNTVIFSYLEDSRDRAIIIDESAVLKFTPDRRSAFSYQLSIHEEVDVFDEPNDDYTRVRVDNGLLGFVLTDHLVNVDSFEGIPVPPLAEAPPLPVIEGRRINMVWDDINYYEHNYFEWRRVPHDGLDVISPTWFKFNLDFSGDLISIASIDYVNWAHEQGYQVWALIDDFSPVREVFSEEISTNILPDTNKRQHVIDQLMNFIEIYNLDGINVDFEYIQPDVAPHYVQFFRELSPYMRAAGKVLSVCMWNPNMPYYWSQFYNRPELSKVVDFIAVMAYDEFQSDVAGPNASMEFVRSGILQTLEEVPHYQIILGIPTYVRVWTVQTIDGVEVHSNRALGLDYAMSIFTQNNAEFTWLPNHGLYFAEYTEGDLLHKAWFEERRSLEEKLIMMEYLDLAGVAAWRRGLESDFVWELLMEYTS